MSICNIDVRGSNADLKLCDLMYFYHVIKGSTLASFFAVFWSVKMVRCYFIWKVGA